MLGNAFGWPHLLIILVVVVLLFGAPKLPRLARSLGQSMRIFRSEVKTMKDENASPADKAASEKAASEKAASDQAAPAADVHAPAAPLADRATVISPESKPKP
jgi:sec-independent protein translocase protein TatA